ncbi:PcfJ domain-containing protein [Flavobacterium sp. 102]|uniref:PcfJ domain-containing protein n=1 Tax=Flavobacterium sp. 102 TaxID=2135623 RepID=UPI000EB5B24D|nr:PcfJ domain-containing protein [Flavobacterium sp. 102]RKS00444.1 PcfJ-like protein [Flavobacterium sp. 102]
MRPSTKLQIEVWKLHKTLPNPKEHEPFVISKHDLYYTTHYKNLVCLECNHTWKPGEVFWKNNSTNRLHQVTCPSCNQRLKKITINNGDFLKIISYSVVQVVERFQVVRYFTCWKRMHKNKKPEYWFRSIFEEWKDYDKNKSVVIGRNITWTGDGFTSSDYEVRRNKNPYGGMTKYDRFGSNFNCPGAEFLPRFDKYGLKKHNNQNCDWRQLIYKLEMQPKVETLLKARQYDLLFHAVHVDSKYNTYWPQIRIMLRNKYKISDVGMWYDYLQLLNEFGKDIRNPKFILPKNLKRAHNEYVVRKQKKIDKANAQRELIRQEKEREQAAKDKILIDMKLEVFKDFSIQKGKIKIVTLIEEEEVKKEGKVLKHCVHANGYHKKAGILLMSARLDGKRLETIELSLSSLQIIQARGVDNKITQHHDEILDIIKKNIKKISKLVEDFKKSRQEDLKILTQSEEAA